METLKRYRLWAIVVSCCMILLGAAMILRPDISALAVCYLTGALCIAMGVCEIARYFSIGVIGILFRFDLIVGILSTLAGVLLLAHPTGALTVLPIILGFYIIIDSVFSIQAAIELRRFGLGSWGLNLLLGIVGAVLGVLMILDPFDGAAALMIYMGVSLLLAGVESIYTVICLSRAFKRRAPEGHRRRLARGLSPPDRPLRKKIPAADDFLLHSPFSCGITFQTYGRFGLLFFSHMAITGRAKSGHSFFKAGE